MADGATSRDQKGNVFMSEYAVASVHDMEIVEGRAAKLVAAHLPHADPDDAMLVAVSVISQ